MKIYFWIQHDMNFFQEQEQARKQTLFLIIVFTVAILVIIVITVFFITGLDVYFEHVPVAVYLASPLEYVKPRYFYLTTLAVIGVVGMGSLYKYQQLSSGGKSVATALGGVKVNRNHANADEKRLLNVVEEMAIASGISPPTVYVLHGEEINAFTAGLSIDDAVIGVTKGCMEKLNREELQGVIAHEFSHIFNGDMRLNLQLTAILHGILLIGLIGEFIFRYSGSKGSRGASGRRKGGGGVPYFIILGAGLAVLGYVGTFLGSLIKANVSRRREYLADATAVQYTRYPRGISGALKKIAYYSSNIYAPAAEVYSHLYFAEGVSSFFSNLTATHPPLVKRIKRVEPHWNGKFPDYNRSKNSKERQHAQAKLEKEKAKAERAEKVSLYKFNKEVKDNREKTTSQTKKELFTQGAIAAAMMQVGTVQEQTVQNVHKEIANLDKRILERLNDPLGAQAVILSLLYHADYKRELYEEVQEKNPYLLLEFANFLQEQHKDLQKQSALIISLSMDALKNLSKEQYKTFKQIVETFVNVDKKITLFEWSLQYIIQRPLELHLDIRDVPKRSGSTIGAVKKEVETLYSMLVQAQYEDEDAAKEAFNNTKKAIHAGALVYIPKEKIDHALFLQAVNAIERIRPAMAQRVFEGVLHSIKLDGKVSETENTFVHAIAQLMQVPLPHDFKLEKI